MDLNINFFYYSNITNLISLILYNHEINTKI